MDYKLANIEVNNYTYIQNTWYMIRRIPNDYYVNETMLRASNQSGTAVYFSAAILPAINPNPQQSDCVVWNRLVPPYNYIDISLNDIPELYYVYVKVSGHPAELSLLGNEIAMADVGGDFQVSEEPPSDGQILVYDETDGLWVPTNPEDFIDEELVSTDYNAGIALSGHRVVILDNGNIYYASCDNITHRYKVFGVLQGAASAGNLTNIRLFGEMEEVGWSWTVGQPVFLGLDGYLVQSRPSEAVFLLQIGYPLSPTKLFVDKKIPIILV